MRRFISFALAFLALGLGLSTPATAQSRLPAYFAGNTLALGQVLGCAIRLEIYFNETQSRLAAAGHSLPPTFQLRTIAGLDVTALKADGLQELQAIATPQYPAEEMITALTELAHREYDGSIAGLPGYNESWSQSAGCVQLFSQFGLMEIYR